MLQIRCANVQNLSFEMTTTIRNKFARSETLILPVILPPTEKCFGFFCKMQYITSFCNDLLLLVKKKNVKFVCQSELKITFYEEGEKIKDIP